MQSPKNSSHSKHISPIRMQLLTGGIIFGKVMFGFETGVFRKRFVDVETHKVLPRGVLIGTCNI